MKKILILVLCFAIGETVMPSKVQANSIETSTSYNSAAIQEVTNLGKLAAEAGLRVFNDYSVKLDMVLFNYYSSAYDQKKSELNTSTGGGGNSIGNISQLQEKVENHSDAFAAFFRTYSWMF